MRETMRRLKNSKPPENNELKHLEDELFEKLCPRHKPTVEPKARKLSLRYEPVVDSSRAKNTQSIFDLAEAKVTFAKDNRKQNYEAPPETKEKTKLEKQRAAILTVIKRKEFEPMAIADGEKVTIEAICRADYPLLFDADSSFTTAWKNARHLSRWQITLVTRSEDVNKNLMRRINCEIITLINSFN